MILRFLDDLRGGDVLGATVLFAGYLVAILLGITLHEFAHAYVAYRLGDLTPVRDGRVTINPLAHFDMFGTLLILLVGFGYGRPVLVNPLNFRMDRRWGMAIVAIAGPITNIIIATVFGLSLRILLATRDFNTPDALLITMQIFSIVVQVNLLLAVFNMIPFPPLDGSKVLLALLPGDLAYRVERFYIQTAQYGFILIMLLFYVGGNFLGGVISAPANLLYSLIVGQ